MAIYRNIRISFWTDTKVIDEFTPEDRYFYLYLFTNPHTNLAGCYELSIKQASVELGYDMFAIKSLLRRFVEVHKVIKFSEQTKEVLILNWHKYNWTSSEKFRKPLGEEISQVKDKGFREYLTRLFNGDNTVLIPYQYPTNTTVVVTDTDTVSITDRCSSNKGGVDFLELLTCEEIAYLKTLYIDAYELIDEVSDDATKKRKTISNPLSYVIGYATNKGWPANEQQTQR